MAVEVLDLTLDGKLVLNVLKGDGSNIDPRAAVAAGMLRCRPQDPVAHHVSGMCHGWQELTEPAARCQHAITLAEQQDDFYIGAAAAWYVIVAPTYTPTKPSCWDWSCASCTDSCLRLR